MFTGIIEKTGSVLSAAARPDGLGLWIATGFSDLVLGESVAVNGACLTVASLGAGGEAQFFLSRETLDRTSLAQAAQVGSRLNLERALRADARLSGHIVQGHVDGVGSLEAVTQDGECYRLRFRVPLPLSRYCVEKGSIAIQGVSLTLNALSAPKAEPAWVEVMIIPHTWQHTTLCDLEPGAPVNIEVDILAKHLEKLWQSTQ
jgi:riboflavin synthase